MKKYAVPLVWLGLLLSVLAEAQVQSKAFRVVLKGLLDHSVPEITAEAAARDSARTIFLDARALREYEVSHLRGAVYVGYDDFDSTRVQALPKDAHLVVYCSVGYRSEKITEKLLAAGFNDVSNLVGGIFEWVNRGYPVYEAEGQTQKVHAYDRIWGVWLRRGKKVYR